MEVKRKEKIKWKKDEECRIIRKHPCVVVLNPKFEKKDEQPLQTGWSSEITTEPSISAQLRKQTSPQIKEEVCEEMTYKAKLIKEKNRLEAQFEVGSIDAVYFENESCRIQFKGIGHDKERPDEWIVYGKREGYGIRNIGFLEHLLKKEPWEKKTDSYYWSYHSWRAVAKIYPKEKKIIVTESLLYDHLKQKAINLEYEKIVKCWEGAI